MFVAESVTLLQLYPVEPIGGKLPIVMGTSSGFIGINNGIVKSMAAGIAAGTITTNVATGIYVYGVIMGASLIGGVFEMGLGFCIKPLRKFCPPVVIGVVVMAIGLSLIPVGINFFGGGGPAVKDFGAIWNLALGMKTLMVIIFFKHFTKGFTSVAAILIGIVAGYIISGIMGACLPRTMIVGGKEVVCAYVTQWGQLGQAKWFELPRLFPVPLRFNVSAIIPMRIMFIVTAVETIGDTAGVVEGGLGRDATDRQGVFRFGCL